jgi:hypothetical protein
LKYIVNKNTYISKYLDTGFTKDFIVPVSSINTFNDFTERTYVDLNYTNITSDIFPSNNPSFLQMDSINITEDMFNTFNTIVSIGISPLNIGKIDILNGKLTLLYFHMQYLILAKFEIENKSLVLNSTIDYDTIYYLYSFYKEFKEKKKDLQLNIYKISSDYIIGTNNVYVYHSSAKYNKLFLKSIYDQSKSILDNINTLTGNLYDKKFIANKSEGTLYKNLLKCMPDNINVYDRDKHDILTSDNITILVGKL